MRGMPPARVLRTKGEMRPFTPGVGSLCSTPRWALNGTRQRAGAAILGSSGGGLVRGKRAPVDHPAPSDFWLVLTRVIVA